MIKTEVHIHKVKNIKELKYTSNFGGFFSYWKAYFIFIKQIFNNSLLSKGTKFLLIYDLIIWKSLWYLFIKPLVCVFSERIVYKGTIETTLKEPKNYTDFKVNVRKSYMLKLFKIIPIFYYQSKPFTTFDKNYLISKF